MARPSVALVSALRETARRLADPSVPYRWSHFAHCNCGHLAQTLTRASPREIYRAAFARPGDWAEQVSEFDPGDRPALDEGAFEPPTVERCSVTGRTLDELVQVMLDAGVDRLELQHLERLSDPAVLKRLGKNTVGLAHGVRENVIAYLGAWADLVEEALPERVRAVSEASAEEWPELAVAAE